MFVDYDSVADSLGHDFEDYGEMATSSLFSSAVPEDEDPAATNANAAAYDPIAPPEPEEQQPPSHFIGGNDESPATTEPPQQLPYTPNPPLLSSARWTTDDIVIVIVLPIVLTILFAFSLRHCYISNRRHAEFLERRQTLRLEQWAAARARNRAMEKKKKERSRDIEKALISKTASKCNCHKSLSPKAKQAFGSMSDLTMHTNVTDDMSEPSSSIHDIENPALDEVSSSLSSGDDNDDDASHNAQMCAICLEPYVGGKDKVSWSKFQMCRHAFHHKCIEGWLAEAKNKEGSCPCCRGPYLKERLVESKDDVAEQMPNENSDAHEEEADSTNEGAQTANGDQITDEEMGSPDHNAQPTDEQNTTAQTTDVSGDDVEEQHGNGDNSAGERRNNSNVQTREEESNRESGVTTSTLEGNSPEETMKKSVTGLEFTSFCIIHGLRRDPKKHGESAFLVKAIDELAGALENV